MEEINPTEFLFRALNEHEEIPPHLTNSYFCDGRSIDPSCVDQEFANFKIRKDILDILHRNRVEKASIIQSVGLPAILDGKNIAIQSQAGSGKTMCYVLACLERRKSVIICPTKELCAQVCEVFQIFESLNINVINLSKLNSEKAIEDQVFVVDSSSTTIFVGTINAALSANTKYFEFPQIDLIVFDEADNLFENYYTQSIRILDKCTKQKMLLSASFPEKFEHILRTACKSFHILKEEKNQSQIKFFSLHTTDKTQSVIDLLNNLSPNQTIIFCKTKKGVDHLHQKMLELDFPVTKLHGDVENRQKNLADFKNLKAKILVCTDLISRGINIPLCNLVINYDLPFFAEKIDFEAYQHRVGRTGRFNTEGFVIDFISSDKDVLILAKLGEKFEFQSNILDPSILENLALAALEFDNGA